MQKFKLIIVLLIFINIKVSAQRDLENITVKATETFYKISGELKMLDTYIVFDTQKRTKQYVFNFKNGGWVIIKNNDSNFVIQAFSKKGQFIIEGNPLFKNSQNSQKVSIDEITALHIVQSINTDGSYVTRDTNSYIEPFMTNVWGGVNCYDANGANVFPTNHFTPNHCSPGCVAISTAQILHHYKWPIEGVGNNVYADNYNGTLIRHQAFYDNTIYDWDNMLDEYMNINSTVAQQEAVGTLMYHTGISVGMDYEPSGSTNNLDNVPFALANYFRYSGTYYDVSANNFWTKLYDHIQAHRPVPVAIHNSENNEGHVFVADGYKTLSSNPYYHINWGWYNVGTTFNGWYNIQGWNPGDLGYDTIDGAIFNMLPEPQITNVSPTGTGDDFIVEWEVSNNLPWDEFTLEQKIDQSSSWTVVASGITQKNYTITNPTGNVYQLRVKAKVQGVYYNNSWSEKEVYVVNGTYNGYASFESSSQYAYAKQTPNNALDFTGDYTFETWIRLHNGNQNGDVIMDEKTVFGFTIEEVSGSDYSIKFTNYSSGLELHSNASGAKLQNEQWVHIAVSKSGNTAKLFVNGVLRDSATGGFNLTASNYYFNIGEKYHGSYSGWIKADMDKIRISKTGRYSTNFAPNINNELSIDANTVSYFTFQNVHRVRLKDSAYNLSFIVKNATNYVNWKFEEDSSTASQENLEMLNQLVQVYPNPTSDNIYINITENQFINVQKLSFKLFNVNGKKVKEFKVSLSNNTINIKNLTSGVYTLIIEGENFKASQKIIKNNL